MAYTADEYVRGLVPRGSPVWCPFHDDSTHPSAVCMSDTGRFWCYACQWGGDQREVVRKLWLSDVPYHIGIVMAEQVIRKEQWGTIETVRPEPLVLEGMNELLTDWARLCCLNLRRHPDKLEQLKQDRGLKNPIALGVGLASDQVFGEFMRKKWPEDLLVRSGICSEGEGPVFNRYRLRNRFVLPEVRQREVVYYQARAQPDDPTSYRYLNPRLPKPLFGFESLDRDTDCVWVVEGVFDMWPLIEAGESAVAVGGVGVSRGNVELLTEHGRGRPVLVAFDNDDGAGPLNARKRVRQLGEAGLRALAVCPTGYKDLGEWAAAEGTDPIIDFGMAQLRGVWA